MIATKPGVTVPTTLDVDWTVEAGIVAVGDQVVLVPDTVATLRFSKRVSGQTWFGVWLDEQAVHALRELLAELSGQKLDRHRMEQINHLQRVLRDLVAHEQEPEPDLLNW